MFSWGVDMTAKTRDCSRIGLRVHGPKIRDSRSIGYL